MPIELLRGPEQIRTAVAAFAELSLATRPQDLFETRRKDTNKNKFTKKNI